MIRKALHTWIDLKIYDFTSLLRLSGGYTIRSLSKRPADTSGETEHEKAVQKENKNKSRQAVQEKKI